ncbi:hypothetical protein VOLCADRAFT_108653 [Volvox carteri f. nagariensis]|uniref:Uncharacterized protein n=1 Tax=Volvox carteri f. nagariensis TaxID=3068 RepID=D8ULL0_VOLCA|nr:uncharacterized protein VOLCADRAFT_108653 [Volvox carteri f. nagariensis]EFJ39389.1 hypothetical protein VOLCADRAFT_108653 [Volvox carteri f. nagariensis]|eukprot:XP_002959546.1 hypothetical protein VOLCADRAFT_108653 [Volvox carteri f. nagariensis]
MPSPRFPCTEEDARGGRAAMPSPRFPCTEEDARGGRAAMPSPRFPCMVRQQEEDARGGRAAMPSPRFPCTDGGPPPITSLLKHPRSRQADLNPGRLGRLGAEVRP